VLALVLNILGFGRPRGIGAGWTYKDGHHAMLGTSAVDTPVRPRCWGNGRDWRRHAPATEEQHQLETAMTERGLLRQTMPKLHPAPERRGRRKSMKVRCRADADDTRGRSVAELTDRAAAG